MWHTKKPKKRKLRGMSVRSVFFGSGFFQMKGSKFTMSQEFIWTAEFSTSLEIYCAFVVGVLHLWGYGPKGHAKSLPLSAPTAGADYTWRTISPGPLLVVDSKRRTAPVGQTVPTSPLTATPLSLRALFFCCPGEASVLSSFHSNIQLLSVFSS